MPAAGFSFRLFFVFFLFCSITLNAQKVKEPHSTEEWVRSYQPFRIAGNLYYVGTYDLGCYLITTNKGHVLINTGLAGSATGIRKNIEELGFRISDVKILLTTQAHYDHTGAMAAIKKLTGAKLMVDEGDADVLLSGGSTDYELGKYGHSFKAVRADRILHNHDKIEIGDMKLEMLHHPGHTKGSCSFIFDVKDETKTYKVLIANMPSIVTDKAFDDIPAYPGIEKDYNFTFTSMKALSFDLWVASHASQFNMHEKHKPGDPYNPSAYADREGYDAALAELERSFKDKISRPGH